MCIRDSIYADEALFRAGIHPLAEAGCLNISQIQRLQPAIVQVLCDAVEAKGSSMRDYLDVNGKKGSFQDQWSVYQQTGKPCPICGTPIQLSLIHISEPTRLGMISYAVFCLKK